MKVSTFLLGSLLLIGGNAFATESDNLIANANEGALGDKGAMAQNGWECWNFPFSYDEIEEEYTFGSPEQVAWNADGPGGNNVRWENKSSVVTYNGASYGGNVAFTRWDNGSMHAYWYVYPVEIKTPGIYNLSVLAGGWSNLSGDSDNSYLKGNGTEAELMLLFSKERGPEGIAWVNDSEEDTEISVLGLPEEGSGKIFQLPKEEGTNDSAVLTKCQVEVDADEAGIYYVEVVGSHAIILTADYQLTFVKEIAGVEGISGTVGAARTTYYGIDGKEIKNPAEGAFVIEKSFMTDGSIRVYKKVIR